jgi:SAM-dependent methyltransferase
MTVHGPRIGESCYTLASYAWMESAMSLSYRLMYLLGFTPWERDPVPAVLREMIEGPAARPPGRALVIGCGMGRHAIYLAQRGWRVTGVDNVARALRVARKRAGERGVTVEFIEADVTCLDGATLNGPFDLMLDAGCFHSMADGERRRYGAGITRLAAAETELLLLDFAPRRRSRPRGAAQHETLQILSGGWDMLRIDRDATTVRLHLAGRADGNWYRLRRRVRAP